MFDHHWAEITVMQFTDHPLPVHQFVTVPWDFNPVPYCQPSSPTQFLPKTGQRNMQHPPSLEWHVWPGRSSIYNNMHYPPHIYIYIYSNCFFFAKKAIPKNWHELLAVCCWRSFENKFSLVFLIDISYDEKALLWANRHYYTCYKHIRAVKSPGPRSNPAF